MTFNGAFPGELEPTGERFHPTMRGAIRYEHLHRYALCLGLVDGLDVLDIASGEGYGSALLASRARRVIGVDLEPRAVEHARRSYYRPNVLYRVGDCTAIPLGDASVDVVVSFETLEHIGAHDAMLGEVRRVLRPGGRLVISSPNKRVYSEEPGYENPYHVRELYYDEFLQLLERHFASVRVHGQRLAAASFVYPLVDRLAGGLPSYGVNGSEAREGLPALDRPMYFIAVCGDAPHAGPGIDSLFVDAHDDMLQLLQDENAAAHRLLRVQQDALTALRSAGDRNLVLEGSIVEQPLELPAAASPDVAGPARAIDGLTAERDEIHADRLRLQRRLDAALRELQDVRERADAYSAEHLRLGGEIERARNETASFASAAAAAQELRNRLVALEVQHAELASRASDDHGEHAAERARANDRIEALERERDEHAADRSRLKSSLDAVKVELERTGAQLRALAAERDNVAARAEQADLVLRAMIASRSWRLTRPLRELAKTFK